MAQSVVPSVGHVWHNDWQDREHQDWRKLQGQDKFKSRQQRLKLLRTQNGRYDRAYSQKPALSIWKKAVKLGDHQRKFDALGMSERKLAVVVIPKDFGAEMDRERIDEKDKKKYTVRNESGDLVFCAEAEYLDRINTISKQYDLVILTPSGTDEMLESLEEVRRRTGKEIDLCEIRSHGSGTGILLADSAQSLWEADAKKLQETPDKAPLAPMLSRQAYDPGDTRTHLTFFHLSKNPRNTGDTPKYRARDRMFKRIERTMNTVIAEDGTLSLMSCWSGGKPTSVHKDDIIIAREMSSTLPGRDVIGCRGKHAADVIAIVPDEPSVSPDEHLSRRKKAT